MRHQTTWISMVIITVITRVSFSDEHNPPRFENVLKIVDLNKDGLIEDSEWAHFEAFRILANRKGIDTSKPLNVDELSSSFDAITNRLSGDQKVSKEPAKLIHWSEPTSKNGSSLLKKSSLPEDYRGYDKDGDGQIGQYEWPRPKLNEFRAIDRNGDGFLEPQEFAVKERRPTPR